MYFECEISIKEVSLFYFKVNHASGKVGAVAKSIENALGRAVPVLIGFLASLLGIGGLADKVLGVIRKIRQRIENAIVKFWTFVKGKAGKLLSKVGIGKLGKKKDKVDNKHIKNMDSEIAPEPFTMNGEAHTLTFEKGEIYMASEKGVLTSKLTKFKNYVSKNPDADEFAGKGSEILNGIDELQAKNQNVKRELNNSNKLVDTNPQKAKKIEEAQAKLDSLSKDVHDFGEKFKLNDLTASKKKKLHNKFFPTNIKEQKLDNGGKRIIYGYAEGKQEFIVDIAPSGYPVKVIGNQLTLHDLGRGFTQDPEGKLKNAGMDSAHIIANMFGGSGYKKAQNIVATSAEYNQIVMRNKEEEIKEFVKKTKKTTHFTLEVSLQYSEDSSIFEMSEVREQLAEHAKTDDERNMLKDEELKIRILQNLNRTNQERIREVYYDLYIHLKDGSVINKDFEIKESDLLFGTK